MLVAISQLKSQILSSNRAKLILLATPIIIGSGVYLYYHYFSNKSATAKTSTKKNPINDKGKNAITDLLKSKLLKSIELKNLGNEFFRQKNYDEALDLYTEAIQICPPDRKKEMATFYQNRAACHEHLKKYEDVISDSTKAIENDKDYIKAYLRRGKAHDILENYDQASYDYYMASYSTQFQNSDYMKLLTDSLEKYANKRANDVIKKRRKYTFQKYMFDHLINKYCRDPLKKIYEEKIDGNYETIINQLFDSDEQDDQLDQDDLLLKGTVELYIGRPEQGKEKMNKIIETATELDYKVNAKLKLAEHSLQNFKIEECEQLIKEALELDVNNADVYYIRSQLHIINRNYEDAIADLNKAIELNPKFAMAIGQKLYIKYQQCLMTNNFVGKNQVEKDFEERIKQFPEFNELLLLYFQILLSENKTEKAENLIAKAIENYPEDPTLYVYRALLYIEKGDIDKTKELLDTALKLDPKCSFAYEMLSDLMVKMENFSQGYEYLEKAINNSTTFEDIKNLIMKQQNLSMQLKSQTIS